MNQVIINQLEKALKCKDDKELRLRVEVLLDMLKEETPRPTYIPVSQPIPNPTVTVYIAQWASRINKLLPFHLVIKSPWKAKSPKQWEANRINRLTIFLQLLSLII
jgi:hypothetical protein